MELILKRKKNSASLACLTVTFALTSRDVSIVQKALKQPLTDSFAHEPTSIKMRKKETSGKRTKTKRIRSPKMLRKLTHRC